MTGSQQPKSRTRSGERQGRHASSGLPQHGPVYDQCQSLHRCCRGIRKSRSPSSRFRQRPSHGPSHRPSHRPGQLQPKMSAFQTQGKMPPYRPCVQSRTRQRRACRHLRLFHIRLVLSGRHPRQLCSETLVFHLRRCMIHHPLCRQAARLVFHHRRLILAVAGGGRRTDRRHLRRCIRRQAARLVFHLLRGEPGRARLVYHRRR